MSIVASSGLLRPMPFGRLEPRAIRDPVIEPLWLGRRVVARVADGSVQIADEDGETIHGLELLRDAIVAATSAEGAQLDGYLVPPFRDTTGIAVLVGGDAALSPAAIGRQMFLGTRSSRREERRDALEASLARRTVVPSGDDAAFVAIDLLELDGESLVGVPLLERKRLLESVVADAATVRRTAMVRLPVEAWFAQWRALGFGAYAVKAANGRYTPGIAAADWAIGGIPRR